MKHLRTYGVAACVAALAAAGCSGGTGAPSTPGLPAGGAMHDSLRGPAVGTITEYPIPHPEKNVPRTFPVGITAGPDGALWFAERGAGKVGRITTAGDISEPARLHSQARFPFFVATGSDGNLWLSGGSLRTYRNESHGKPDPYAAIWRVTPAGDATPFPLPTFSDPRSMRLGPDGNLWFNETSGNIGRITTDGAITQFAVPHDNAVNGGLGVGPDGALWFGETYHDKLGRITTAGKIKVCSVPSPAGIAAGPDGNLWVSEFLHGKVARVTTSCKITGEFALSSPQASPKGIAVGADGNLYVAEFDGGKIAQVTVDGAVTEIDIPTPDSGPWNITAGPDGNIWFTESLVGKIGKLSL